MKRKREQYQIIIFIKGVEKLHEGVKAHVKTMVMEYFSTILFHNLKHLLTGSIRTEDVEKNDTILIKLT